jgi:hypothetical protein
MFRGADPASVEWVAWDRPAMAGSDVYSLFVMMVVIWAAVCRGGVDVDGMRHLASEATPTVFPSAETAVVISVASSHVAAGNANLDDREEHRHPRHSHRRLLC